MVLLKTRVRLTPFIVLALLMINACAGPHDAVVPASPPATDVASRHIDSSGGHQLWGFWLGFIPATHDSLELVPMRGAEIHLNARRFLEVNPCKDCVTLQGLEVDQVNQTLKVEIVLKHPFPGLERFTGFDVRAIVISDGSLYFPSLDARVPVPPGLTDPATGDFTLAVPDGYTRLWNTLEFPPGSGPFKILEYSQGNLASPGDFTSTVNPYIEYSEYPRRHFPAGGSISQVLHFKLIPGPIRFGYAIDASWEPPLVDPPLDILTDFPVSANALEPISIGWSLMGTLTETVGSADTGKAGLIDMQACTDIESALLECPDLWNGTVSASKIDCESIGTDGYYLSVEFPLTNELGTAHGSYPALLRVVDTAYDYWLGDINHMYQLVWIPVADTQEPQLVGEMVFTAPGPPDPDGFPGALNVFLLDLDTMQETQLTPFVGVGAIFMEPRINPAGTHMLLTFCPTPYASKVDVYEIGGGSWTASPAGVYDGTADFHPDGEHLLVASGAQWGQTFDLYSMKYDGSDRTFIATAPDTVSNPRWSPDGKRIAMTLGKWIVDPPQTSLWIYNVDSGEFTKILDAPGVDENPSWSPVKIDGSYLIVYASSRDHNPEYETDIYVANPDTEEILYRLDTGVSESHPSFSPDGLSFVYSADSAGDTELFVFSWKTEDSVQLTDDDTWDGSPSWGWNW